MLTIVALGAIILCIFVIATYHSATTPMSLGGPDQPVFGLVPGALIQRLHSRPGGDPDRSVQLDHVPDHLHLDAGTVFGSGLGDFGPDVHGDLRRRLYFAGLRLRRG